MSLPGSGMGESSYYIRISPESLLTNLEWREMLQSEVYREAFVIDEAHCVKQW